VGHGHCARMRKPAKSHRDFDYDLARGWCDNTARVAVAAPTGVDSDARALLRCRQRRQSKIGAFDRTHRQRNRRGQRPNKPWLVTAPRLTPQNSLWIISTPTRIGDVSGSKAVAGPSSSPSNDECSQSSICRRPKISGTRVSTQTHPRWIQKPRTLIPQEISAHPEHSRRPAHCVRVVRPRVSGMRQRVTSSVSESARQHDLWPGVWHIIQYHYPGDDYKDLMPAWTKSSSAATSMKRSWRDGAAGAGC